MSKTKQKIALVGNPNCGKTTLFNELTGLHQRTGNYPGITVDVKKGTWGDGKSEPIQLIDLPGAYSLYPTASDERIVVRVLANPLDDYYPDAIIYVASAVNLEKHLLLLSQVIDLQIPVLLAINMSDVAKKDGIVINTRKLADELGVQVILLSARTGENLHLLKEAAIKLLWQEASSAKSQKPFRKMPESEWQMAEAIRFNTGIRNNYRAILWAHHGDWLPFLDGNMKSTVENITKTKGFPSLKWQIEETLGRFDRIVPMLREVVKVSNPNYESTMTDKIDNVLTHRFFGPIVFVLAMSLVFKAIFSWSTYPMEWIEGGFAKLTSLLRYVLGESWFTSLLTDGLLAGLSGILVFVPQIAILFLLITILEEVGYMARVVFMFDRLLQRFGMNGRSIVALISGGACAVPAIMTSRTISNWQEKLITVFVTPFISCSARLPVYAVLIGLAVPSTSVMGVFDMQTLTLMGLYLLGVVVALLSGFVLKRFLGRKEPSFLTIELPEYRMPHWKNVFHTVWEKVSAFAKGAGKIIIVISLVLWGLSNYGPGNAMESAVADAQAKAASAQLPKEDADKMESTAKLEASYAGQLGKLIEPAIRPLGYDWKIGIALITSFAAREVFVGTMSTIYSLGGTNDDESLLREKMQADRFVDTQKPVYTLATALSLLVFYALAMQCMSTMAVVRKETGSWKWTIIQFIYMSVLAYLAAWLVYNLFS